MTIEHQPQPVFDDPSYLCSNQLTPHRMTGFLLQHFLNHFGHAEQAGISPLRSCVWHSDPMRSKILIESLTRWDPTQAGVRPAILIRRNDWEVSQIAIGNLMQGSQLTDGTQRYSVLMSGSHTIFCLSVEAAECEELAFEVFQQLLEFCPLIRAKLGLNKILPSQLGKPLPVLESREHFGIPITVGYCHNFNWSTRQHAPVLGSVEIRPTM